MAREHAHAGVPEGLLVLAEQQTAGRGRQGRRWEAPFGSCILASLLLRPTFLPAGQAFLLTALAALAIDRAIRSETGLGPALKWPNDLLIQGRKVCGILTELGAAEQKGPASKGWQEEEVGLARDGLEPARPAPDPHLSWAVMGFGLNVNVDFAMHEELSARATSLALELGQPLDRLPLLWACLQGIESLYEGLRAGQGDEIWATWHDRLSIIGREVEIAAPEGPIAGQVVDVDRSGALRVRQADGAEARVLAGDLTWAPPS